MVFATALRDSLQMRQRRVQAELANGDSLEHVLSRHLIAVEMLADRETFTSVLLLDRDGERLFHGAAPNLPVAFCRAIDGGRIGPKAGSCGTAAYLCRPVYVADIAADPLWIDYRDIALGHGFRACWSTPIFDSDRAVIGTFAIYHRDVGGPTPEEIEAIDMITDHVADAILRARNDGGRKRPALRLVGKEAVPSAGPDPVEALLRNLETLESHAHDLDRSASISSSDDAAEAFKTAAIDCKRLISVIRSRIDGARSTS